MMSVPHPDSARLSAWSRGALSAEESGGIERHVENCDECAAALTAATTSDRLEGALQSAFREPPTEPFATGNVTKGTVLSDRFTLLERIGEGGMGSVWLAQQIEPIQRRVAVKLLKSGLETASSLARFEIERQALALMDHPNIAKVFDAGVTASPARQPYVVMELVQGSPITTYCDQHRLGLRQRLELFIPVCQAIQHAHQKGVIHRDLKPSNLLVADYGNGPTPKVIDFGVAKSAGQPFGVGEATAVGVIVGTPDYMSPEQANLDDPDVDTRSDVYSLGVVLYELLSGRSPHTRLDSEPAGMLEMLRHIREDEPPRPSDMMRSSDSREWLTKVQGTNAAEFHRLVRGELDWIVMKCLEKDRDRRYETATGLANDVRRFLDGQPVRAVPPTASYRLKKFIGRNRALVAAGSAVFVALALGVAGTTIGLLRADAQRNRAVDAEGKALAQAAIAEQNLQRIAAAHVDLVALVFQVAHRVKVESTEAALKVLLAEMDRITNWLNEAEVQDPKQRRQLRVMAGQALRVLERYGPALRLAERNLAEAEAEFGQASPETAGSLVEVSLLHRLAGNAAQADRFRKRAVTTLQSLPLPTAENLPAHVQLMLYLREWIDEPDLASLQVERLLAYARQSRPSDDQLLLNMRHQLAWARLRQGKMDEAIALEREVLEAYERRSPRDDSMQRQLAHDAQQLMINAGRVDPDMLAHLRRILGDGGLNFGVLAVRGSQLLREKEWAAAEAILRECLSRREAAEPDAWTTFNTRSLLGASLAGQGRFADAEPLLLSGFHGMKERNAKIPADGKVRLQEAVERLAQLYDATNRSDEAAKWRTELAEIQKSLSP